MRELCEIGYEEPAAMFGRGWTWQEQEVVRDVVVVSMHYYGFCIYFSVTIWDCMNIVDYLDCVRHIMLVLMFVVVVFCSLDN